jgi:hypothetical protein
MEVVSIVIQCPLNALDAMMEDTYQSGPPNSDQKGLKAIKKMHWGTERDSCQFAFSVPKGQKSKGAKLAR